MLLQQADVVFWHFWKDSEIGIFHVQHQWRLRLPTPAFLFTIILDKVVVSRVNMWTGVIPLEDWKIVFEVTALAHQPQNFWK